jgi:hypothetical protein
MSRPQLRSAEQVGSALHVRWDVERDDGEHLRATVVIASPHAPHATIQTTWSDGTGDPALDAELVRRTNQVLAFAAVGQLAREWMSDGHRPPKRDGRRLAAVA